MGYYVLIKQVPTSKERTVTTTMIFLESKDEVELGTEPLELFETTDHGDFHSAHPFTVAIFSGDGDDVELGTEPWVVI